MQAQRDFDKGIVKGCRDTCQTELHKRMLPAGSPNTAIRERKSSVKYWIEWLKKYLVDQRTETRQEQIQMEIASDGTS